MAYLPELKISPLVITIPAHKSFTEKGRRGKNLRKTCLVVNAQVILVGIRAVQWRQDKPVVASSAGDSLAGKREDGASSAGHIAGLEAVDVEVDILDCTVCLAHAVVGNQDGFGVANRAALVERWDGARSGEEGGEGEEVHFCGVLGLEESIGRR